MQAFALGEHGKLCQLLQLTGATAGSSYATSQVSGGGGLGVAHVANVTIMNGRLIGVISGHLGSW